MNEDRKIAMNVLYVVLLLCGIALALTFVAGYISNAVQ